MTENTLVTVVIPTYSRSESLKRAINSVLGQTYRNIEILVIDDNPPGSGWRAACEKTMGDYAGNEMVRYIQNEKNLGGAGARNVGIAQAKGTYIAFLDDDDAYLPEKVEKQLRRFWESGNEKLALVYCYARFIDRDGGSTYSDRRDFHGNCLYEAMEQNCIAATSQWMVKKSAVVELGGFPDVPCKQDSQLILKLLTAGYEVDVVPEELSLYYNYEIGSRISGAGEKNICGELLYQTECRKQYYRLEDWQILNIEYKFASIFYRLYKANGQKEKTRHAWGIMCRLHKKEALLYRLKEGWHFVKDLAKRR